MARIRTIKPDFWTDEKVVELSAFARLLFIGLWNFADDEGRMVYSPKKIKMQIFPSDILDISELFGEIRGKKLVDIYAIEGVEYLQIKGFANHQKIDKRSASKLPANPTNPSESPRIPPTDQGREGIKEGSSEAKGDFQKVFDAGCEYYPALASKDTTPIRQWLEAGCCVEKDILPTLKRLAGKSISTWHYFINPVMDAKATREKPLPKGTAKQSHTRYAEPKKSNVKTL